MSRDLWHEFKEARRRENIEAGILLTPLGVVDMKHDELPWGIKIERLAREAGLAAIHLLEANDACNHAELTRASAIAELKAAEEELALFIDDLSRNPRKE